MPSVGAFGEAVAIVTDEGAPSPRRQKLTALENSWFEEHYSRSQLLREALPPLDPVEEQFWVYFYESRARWCSALFSINSFFLTLMLAVVNLAYPEEKQSAHFIELYVSIAGYLVISLTFLIFFFGIQYFPSFMFNSATKSAAQGKRRSEKQEQEQGESEGDGEGRSITGTARGLGIFLLLCRACTLVQTLLFFRSMGLHEHDEQFTYSPARIIFAIFLDQLQSMFVLDVVFPVPSFANVYLSLTILNHLALMAAHDMRNARATGLVTGLLLPIVIFADLTAPLAAYWVFVSQKNLYISLQAYKSTSVPTIKIVDRLASDCKEPVAAVISVLLGQEFCDFRNTLQGSARRKAAEAVALLRGEDVRLSLLTGPLASAPSLSLSQLFLSQHSPFLPFWNFLFFFIYPTLPCRQHDVSHPHREGKRLLHRPQHPAPPSHRRGGDSDAPALPTRRLSPRPLAPTRQRRADAAADASPHHARRPDNPAHAD